MPWPVAQRFAAFGLAWLIGSSVAVADAPGKPKRLALLVGCTKYDHLPAESQLSGPANDVQLLRATLSGRFGFDDFRLLTEEAGAQRRPTRANIAAAFEQLARDAGPGDRVFILLAGHGSQQPVAVDDADPENFEADGLDEVFLPADVRPGEDDRPASGAITDNQIRRWLLALRAKGASIWIVVDACHSGSMVRGNGAERVREVPVDVLNPQRQLDQARAIVEARPAAQPEASVTSFQIPPDEPELVAMYAAQPDEPTVELDLPRGARDARPQGLLTFALCSVIAESASPLTYRELLTRVQARYAGWGRAFPTPSIEGREQHQLLFRDEVVPPAPVFTLSSGDDGSWRIDAGALRGLTEGTVLRLLPANKTAKPALAGHVRILAKGLSAAQATVEPCEFDNVPAPSTLVSGTRCEVAYQDFGLQRVQLAIAPERGLRARSGAASRMSDDEITALRRRLDDGKNVGPLFTWCDDPADADWLIRQLDARSEQLYLVPASGIAVSRVNAEPSAAFGPLPREHAGAWLAERLARIQKVTNLERVADRFALQGAMARALNVQLLKLKSPQDPAGVSLDETVLEPGDYLGVRIENRGRERLDVTILVIDSAYGIAPLFPRSAGVDNRLAPGGAPLALAARVNGRTLGTERLLVIAARPREQTTFDFSFLAQPSLEQARLTVQSRGLAAQGRTSPLGQLLDRAAFGEGTVRGLKASEAGTAQLLLKTWRVVPAAKPAK